MATSGAVNSKHGIEYYKYIIMFNPVFRDPIPVGDIVIMGDVMEECLKNDGMSLHTFDPLEVIDKIGYVKRGDEAGDLLLDALQKWIQLQLMNGAVFPTNVDILKQIQKNVQDALRDAQQDPTI